MIQSDRSIDARWSNAQHVAKCPPVGFSDEVPEDWFDRFGFGPRVAPRFETILAGFEHFARVQPDQTAVQRPNHVPWRSPGQPR